MAVVVKVSDAIKLLKEIRNDGIKEISFCELEGDDEIPPSIRINGIDPEGLFDYIDCGDIYGREVDM